MYGHDLVAYRDRVQAFGWRCILLDDGHDLERVVEALAQANSPCDVPTMVIAGTVKGKGVSFLENELGWHGKALSGDKLKAALDEIGTPPDRPRGKLRSPESPECHEMEAGTAAPISYQLGDELATRDAYGNALCRLAEKYPTLVSLDGEVCNSTRSKKFRDAHPGRFFEMFIAEQNMIGAATGLALCGKLPFVSTFAAFFTRAFDQIRMALYSDANMKFVGSHNAGQLFGGPQASDKRITRATTRRPRIVRQRDCGSGEVVYRPWDIKRGGSRGVTRSVFRPSGHGIRRRLRKSMICVRFRKQCLD